jgi:uncharacterized membrane protein
VWSNLLVREEAALVMIVALAAVIRLATLGAQSFWLDEGVSYFTAMRPLPSLLDFVAREDIHPPLYYLLLHVWAVFGTGEAWLRLPSALAGIASVWLLGLLGRWLFDARTGLAAAAVLAVSPLHVWYSQEARMYALLALLALAQVACLWRALAADGRSRWWWAGVGLCGAAMLYTSTSALWMLAALNLFLLLRLVVTRHWRALLPWLLSQALTVALFLPWLPALRAQIIASRAQGSWIAPPTIGSVINFFGDVNSRNLTLWTQSALQSGLNGLLQSLATNPLQTLLAPVNLLVVAAVLATGAILTLRRRTAGYGLLWCWLLVPVGLAFLLSQQYYRPPLLLAVLGEAQSVFTVKNLIVAALPFYLLVGHVVTRGPRLLMAAGLLLLLGLNLGSYMLEGQLRAKEDWRGVVAELSGQIRPADVVIFSPGYLESPFAYYLERTGTTATRRGFPRDDVTLLDPVRYWPTPQAAVAGAERVWLIETRGHAPVSPALADYLAATGAPAWERTWPGDVTVRRYDRP